MARPRWGIPPGVRGDHYRPAEPAPAGPPHPAGAIENAHFHPTWSGCSLAPVPPKPGSRANRDQYSGRMVGSAGPPLVDTGQVAGVRRDSGVSASGPSAEWATPTPGRAAAGNARGGRRNQAALSRMIGMSRSVFFWYPW